MGYFLGSKRTSSQCGEYSDWDADHDIGEEDTHGQQEFITMDGGEKISLKEGWWVSRRRSLVISSLQLNTSTAKS